MMMALNILAAIFVIGGGTMPREHRLPDAVLAAACVIAAPLYRKRSGA